MNIDNVVLVRARNKLPVEGELIPSCEGMYLKPDTLGDFATILRNMVKRDLENKLGRPLVLYAESEDAKMLDQAMEKFYPYTSSYTSTLSFSLNGLVPDDINNKFSEMKCAVIEPLKYHTDADFLNVSVIDTTTKGSMQLSNEAILVCDENTFRSYPESVQQNLMAKYRVELFTGSLKDAVNNTLQKYNYPVFNLNQRKEQGYIEECPEKANMQAFEDAFALSVNASRLRLAQLYQEPFLTGDDLVAGDKAKSDFYKSLEVDAYYKEELYKFLLMKADMLGIDISDDDKFYLFSEYGRGEEVLEELMRSLVSRSGGLESFAGHVAEYNQNVVNNYLTNEQIIALRGEARN